MKKNTVFLIASSAFVVILAFFLKENKTVTKEEFRELIDNHPIKERLKLSKSERKKAGIPPNRYFDDQYLLEMNPATGKTNPENIQAIVEEERASKSLSRAGVAPGEEVNNSWIDRGPNNIGGRTRVVFYDPNDPNGTRVFAGGVSGGLWVNDDITNASSSWTQVGIDENLAITCYAIDPNDSNTWYVGTGEAYTHNDGTGNGAWYTTDGGATWEVLWSINLNQGRARRPYFFNEIVAWDNNGTTEVFFSLDGWLDYNFVGFNASGWYKMDTNGDIGQIEFDVDGSTRAYVFSDVEIAADNSLWCATKENRWSTGGGEIYRTTDGENFTQKYALSNGDRVELSVSKTDANVVYALVEEGNSTGVRIVKTTDGENFTVLAEPADVDTGIDADHFTRGQAFYNLMIKVDPADDDIVYVGGIDLFRSDDGGASWDQISKWSNNNDLADLDVSLVHADHHELIFDPTDSNKGIFATDGGVYYSSDLSSAASSETAIVARNNDFNITQFYSGAIGPDPENEMLLGGAQDNGSLYVANATSGTNSFTEIFSGDGVATFIDKDEEYLIVSFVFNVYESYILPITSSSRSIEIRDDTSRGAFANIADLDDNLDILYADASEPSDDKYRITRYADLTSGNPVVTSFLNSSILDGVPTAIKVSPYTTDATTLFVGTDTGTIIKMENIDNSNNTPTYTNLDVDGVLNTGSISGIAFGENEDEILVTFHNYGVNNIYYTADGGANWVVKDGDFADIPVKAIMMNPMDSNEVIIGTNYGVWQTDNFSDANPTWEHSRNGMSSVKVTSFELREADNTVLASTYGRGLFTSTFTTNESLSIDLNEIDDNSIIIYPTVSSDGVFNLKTTQENDITSVEVYNLKGSKVYDVQNLELENSNVEQIKLEVSTGVYIVKVYSGNKVLKSQRVIIE